MKAKYAALTLALISLSGSVFAATTDSNGDNVDGTVSITGRVVAQTCTVSGDSGTTVNVTLPTVQSTLLSTAAQTAGLTPFTIKLTGCTAVASSSTSPKTVGVYFSPATTFDSTTGTLTNTTTSGATKVNVQLLNGSDKSAIKIGQAITAQNVTYPGTLPTSGTTGSVNLAYYAQYYATGQATEGAVTATAPFTIVYN